MDHVALVKRISSVSLLVCSFIACGEQKPKPPIYVTPDRPVAPSPEEQDTAAPVNPAPTPQPELPTEPSHNELEPVPEPEDVLPSTVLPNTIFGDYLADQGFSGTLNEVNYIADAVRDYAPTPFGLADVQFLTWLMTDNARQEMIANTSVEDLIVRQVESMRTENQVNNQTRTYFFADVNNNTLLDADDLLFESPQHPVFESYFEFEPSIQLVPFTGAGSYQNRKMLLELQGGVSAAIGSMLFPSQGSQVVAFAGNGVLRYNENFWEATGGFVAGFRLKAGVPMSVAIDDLFDVNPTLYTLDCGSAIPLMFMRGMMDWMERAYGFEQGRAYFNQAFSELSVQGLATTGAIDWHFKHDGNGGIPTTVSEREAILRSVRPGDWMFLDNGGDDGTVLANQGDNGIIVGNENGLLEMFVHPVGTIYIPQSNNSTNLQLLNKRRRMVPNINFLERQGIPAP